MIARVLYGVEMVAQGVYASRNVPGFDAAVVAGLVTAPAVEGGLYPCFAGFVCSQANPASPKTRAASVAFPSYAQRRQWDQHLAAAFPQDLAKKFVLVTEQE